MSEALPAEGSARAKPLSPPEGPVITIQQQAYEDRQRRYAAETEQHRRYWLRELEERFDHRHDGLAAKRRFDEALGLYATLFMNGSRCLALAPLIQAERRLQRARGDAR
jgi:hypothetical protein